MTPSSRRLSQFYPALLARTLQCGAGSVAGWDGMVCCRTLQCGGGSVAGSEGEEDVGVEVVRLRDMG